MTSPADTYLEIAVIRRFEERCVALKADGLIEGSMHQCSGQEAIPVGACRALARPTPCPSPTAATGGRSHEVSLWSTCSPS